MQTVHRLIIVASGLLKQACIQLLIDASKVVYFGLPGCYVEALLAPLGMHLLLLMCTPNAHVWKCGWGCQHVNKTLQTPS